MSTYLAEFCSETALDEISKEKAEAFINSLWSKARKQYESGSGGKMELKHHARQQIRDGIMQRLDLMAEWLGMTEATVKQSSARLKAVRESLQRLIPEIRDKLVGKKEQFCGGMRHAGAFAGAPFRERCPFYTLH